MRPCFEASANLVMHHIRITVNPHFRFQANKAYQALVPLQQSEQGRRGNHFYYYAQEDVYLDPEITATPQPIMVATVTALRERPPKKTYATICVMEAARKEGEKIKAALARAASVGKEGESDEAEIKSARIAKDEPEQTLQKLEMLYPGISKFPSCMNTTGIIGRPGEGTEKAEQLRSCGVDVARGGWHNYNKIRTSACAYIASYKTGADPSKVAAACKRHLDMSKAQEVERREKISNTTPSDDALKSPEGKEATTTKTAPSPAPSTSPIDSEDDEVVEVEIEDKKKQGRSSSEQNEGASEANNPESEDDGGDENTLHTGPRKRVAPKEKKPATEIDDKKKRFIERAKREERKREERKKKKASSSSSSSKAKKGGK